MIVAQGPFGCSYSFAERCHAINSIHRMLSGGNSPGIPCRSRSRACRICNCSMWPTSSGRCCCRGWVRVLFPSLISFSLLNYADVLYAGKTWGRVRSMRSPSGATVKEAGPSSPVEIFGLRACPDSGSELIVVCASPFSSLFFSLLNEFYGIFLSG